MGSLATNLGFLLTTPSEPTGSFFFGKGVSTYDCWQ